MDVKIKTRSDIAKSFAGLLHIVIKGLVPFAVIISWSIFWLLGNVLGANDTIQKVSAILAFGLTVVGYFYVTSKWLLDSLSEYELSYDNERIFMSGRSGWKKIEISVPTNEISRICIGDPSEIITELTSGNGGIEEQMKCQLTLIKLRGQSYKLNYATKAFDLSSLAEFLKVIGDAGVGTNYKA